MPHVGQDSRDTWGLEESLSFTEQAWFVKCIIDFELKNIGEKNWDHGCSPKTELWCNFTYKKLKLWKFQFTSYIY